MRPHHPSASCLAQRSARAMPHASPGPPREKTNISKGSLLLAGLRNISMLPKLSGMLCVGVGVWCVWQRQQVAVDVKHSTHKHATHRQKPWP